MGLGNTFFQTYGNTYGAPSGGAGGSGYPTSATINSSVPFFFNGADFSTFAKNDAYWSGAAEAITVNAYDASSNLLGSKFIELSPTGYNFETFNIANVTSLVFVTDSFACDPLNCRWLMDDFTYNVSPTTPEPGTLGLLRTGAIGAIAAIRRRWII